MTNVLFHNLKLIMVFMLISSMIGLSLSLMKSKKDERSGYSGE
jgi:hypothetical protein